LNEDIHIHMRPCPDVIGTATDDDTSGKGHQLLRAHDGALENLKITSRQVSTMMNVRPNAAIAFMKLLTLYPLRYAPIESPPQALSFRPLPAGH
jgi:hypothetical protein